MAIDQIRKEAAIKVVVSACYNIDHMCGSRTVKKICYIFRGVDSSTPSSRDTNKKNPFFSQGKLLRGKKELKVKNGKEFTQPGHCANLCRMSDGLKRAYIGGYGIGQAD